MWLTKSESELIYRMKKSYLKIVMVIISVFSCMGLYVAFGESSGEDDTNKASSLGDVYTFADSAVSETKIYCQEVEGEYYLFLPAGMPKVISLYGLDGTVTQVDLSDKNVDASGARDIETSLGNLKVMNSANIRSVYLTSDDVENYGREWVDLDNDHQNRTTGEIVVFNENGVVTDRSKLDMIRVRGNATAIEPKKPYKVKLTKKKDLLGVGRNTKEYALLAGSTDPSLIRNRLVFDLGEELGYQYSVHAKNVDLYYDGEYRGNYLLAELPEIEMTPAYNGAQEIVNQSVNGKIDKSNITIAQDVNSFGLQFSYVENYKDPDTVDGGYFLELDNGYYAGTPSTFVTSNGTHYVVKSPKYCSKAEMLYISELVEKAYRAATNNGINPETGKGIEEYIDFDTLSQVWSMQEVCGNRDSFNSSTFFYICSGEDTLHTGPLWDFDNGAGVMEKDADTMKYYFYMGVFTQLHIMQKACDKYYSDNVYELIKKYVPKQCDMYYAELAASEQMNATIWPRSGDSFYQNIKDVEEYYLQKNESIKITMSNWPGDINNQSVSIVNRDFAVGADTTLKLYYDKEKDGIYVRDIKCDSEDKYFQEGKNYRYTIDIEPSYGSKFGNDISVKFMNGNVESKRILEDGTLEVVLDAGIPQKKNTVYAGVDFDLVYDKEWYLEHHPEVKELVGTEDDAVLTYFVETGIPNGDQACEDFSIESYYLTNSASLGPVYGQDYSMLMTHYLQYGGYEMGFRGTPIEDDHLEE